MKDEREIKNIRNKEMKKEREREDIRYEWRVQEKKGQKRRIKDLRENWISENIEG